MIESARLRIAEIAAGWQRDGLDTSPLAGPVLRIEEALAELRRLDEVDEPPPGDRGMRGRGPRRRA